MGLQVLWSFGLACLDVYALKIKRDLQNPVLVSLFVVGDWVIKFFYVSIMLATCTSYIHIDESSIFCSCKNYNLLFCLFQYVVTHVFVNLVHWHFIYLFFLFWTFIEMQWEKTTKPKATLLRGKYTSFISLLSTTTRKKACMWTNKGNHSMYSLLGEGDC